MVASPADAREQQAELGAFVTRRRKVLHWSQDELAERANLSVRTIRNLESGAIRHPRQSSVKLVLAALQISNFFHVHEGLESSGAYFCTAVAQHVIHDQPPIKFSFDSGIPTGRAFEIEQICSALNTERWIALIGPGGVGKSTVALAVSEIMWPNFRDGVVVIEAGFANADDIADLEGQVIRVLEACDRSSPKYRSTKPDAELLVVIDNADHLTDRIIDFANRLLRASPKIRILMTSRKPLTVSSVRSWEIAPLCASRGSASPAVELLIHRAAAACPTLDLSHSETELTELSAALDNMPLALELAALRLRSVSLETMLRTGVIRQVRRQMRSDGLPHQRTLDANVRWSFEPLSTDHKHFLFCLARFSGFFGMDDIEGESEVHQWPANTLINMLSDLVESSLVQVKHGATYRYRLFSYVRAAIRDWAPSEPFPVAG